MSRVRTCPTNIIILAQWVVQVVLIQLECLDTTQRLADSANKTLIISAVRAGVPPPSTTELLLLQVLRLESLDLRCIEADELASLVIVRPGRNDLLVSVHGAAIQRERLVIEHTGFPGAVAGAVEALAEAMVKAVGVGEGATVQRHAEDDLAGSGDLGRVVLDRLHGVEVS